MRADSMRSGACTRGSTARPKAATRAGCGGAGATSTRSAERNDDGEYADARRCNADGDAVDACPGTKLDWCRGVIPRYVGRDDGGDDAAVTRPDVTALSPGRRRHRRK